MILLMLVITLTGVILLVLQFRTNPIEEAVQKGDQLKLLLMVRDGYELVYRELICMDSKTGQSVMFNIPVDTGYWNPVQARFRKIGLLYQPGKCDKLVKAIEVMSGEDIPYHIEMSRDQLSNLIDFIGGVPLFLIDPLSIEFDGSRRMLPGGAFTLYGYQSLFYLQSLLPGETRSEQIKRKQVMLKTIFKQAGELSQQIVKKDANKVIYSLF